MSAKRESVYPKTLWPVSDTVADEDVRAPSIDASQFNEIDFLGKAGFLIIAGISHLLLGAGAEAEAQTAVK